MRIGHPFLILVAILTSCSPTEAGPTIEQARAAQAQSQWGPTKTWKVTSAQWTKSTQAMRDRGYLFCLRKKAGDQRCFAEQDYSLISANQAETLAAMFVSNVEDSFPFARGIRDRPFLFTEARRYCLQVYEDAGASDARMLGPCLLNAVGGDYFGIVSVN